MIFTELSLAGAYLIELEKIEDKRGFFARTFCAKEFTQRGLNPNLAQCSISYNVHKNILRGMHYQKKPHEEVKLVRCIQGAIYDVIVDLRKESPTYRQWTAAKLNADNRNMLYIPEGFAHGFQTLTDTSEVAYQMTEYYYPESAAGARWDDPAFSIEWPEASSRIISDKDLNYPDFKA